MTTILVASLNKKKLKELRDLLQLPGVSFVSLSDVPPVNEVEEDGATFEENAAKKALGYARQTGMMTIADDSGLCVDYLKGAPGVYSARYAGEGKDDHANNLKVLAEMNGVPDSERTANFTAAVALATPEKVLTVVVGKVHGFLTHEIRGSGGFGYDVIFYFPAFGATFGETPPEMKYQVSHRAQALHKMQEFMRGYFERT